jgi:hypothetical protein
MALLTIPVLSLAVAPVVVIVALTGALVQTRWPGRDMAQVVVMAIAWCLCAWILIVMARRVVAIRVGTTGTVEFVRTLGRTVLPSSAIRQLEGRLVSGYDGKEWMLFVRHANGTVKIDEFADARSFADLVQSLNPAVEIAGIWPMGPP